jgi:hypothetical protein
MNNSVRVDGASWTACPGVSQKWRREVDTVSGYGVHGRVMNISVSEVDTLSRWAKDGGVDKNSVIVDGGPLSQLRFRPQQLQEGTRPLGWC